MSSIVDFVGEPFDAVAWLGAPSTGEPDAVPAVPRPPVGGPAEDTLRTSIRALREAVVSAHLTALGAQEAMQRMLLSGSGVPHWTGTGPAEPRAVVPAPEGAFKPLARTPVQALNADQLQRIARGEAAVVFGPAYDQDGANPDLLVGGGAVLAVTALSRIELRGGTAGAGLLVAAVDGDPGAALRQLAEIFAIYTGLHLCHVDAKFVVVEGGLDTGEPSRGELHMEVSDIELLPRPRLRATGRFGPVVGESMAIPPLTLEIREKPGVPVGPARGGDTVWFGRRSASGGRALLGEFHLVHLSRGDQQTALGPEFAIYTGRKATRLPTGGLLLVDRVVSIDGKRGLLDSAAYVTEYDSHADSWYYADTANASMPHFVYMETSLQAALLVGYYLGATLKMPDAPVSLRNLGGTATVLREVDLRDKTITQHSELLSTTVMPDSSLQSFRYLLAVDGEPFYEGETMFGYFSDAALANQTGLDAGRCAPTWLETQEPPPPTRRLDIASRRVGDGAALRSHGKLALLDWVDVVDGGGHHGKGYLHAVRAIDPDDWYFRRHFHLDPVIPGSLGVESVIQALQEWVLDSGLGDDLSAPEFIVPVDAPFTWKYRGQFLPTDGDCTFEAHIREVRRTPGRVRVVADASLWKPGLRIYELTGLAVELREPGAPR